MSAHVGERGSVALTVLIGSVLFAFVAVATITAVVDVVVAHARAQAAADAAALAAAGTSPLAGGEGDPAPAAGAVAAAGGAELENIALDGWPLRVTVVASVATELPFVRAVVPRMSATAAAALVPHTQTVVGGT